MGRRIIGIDPGLSGAVAAICTVGVSVKFESVIDTPVLSVKRGKKTKREYLVKRMVAILKELDVTYVGRLEEDDETSLVCIENVHAMPQQGVTSMFRMGLGLGLWRGIATALDFQIEMVSPVKWKRVMVGTGVDKAASILKAVEVFPKAEPFLRRKKDHGRAEALLMAEYARRTVIR